MHILVLNWRDIKNPYAGGAELLTHEMAKRWVTYGHSVTQISQKYTKCLRTEKIDGVEIIRVGHWWSVHIYAYMLYVKTLSMKVDVIVDEIHWFPFFSVFYARKRIIFLVCEVANPLFFSLLPIPLAYIARIVEKISFSFYKQLPVLAISSSTKQDLIHEGFDPKKISVLPMGIQEPPALEHAIHKTLIPTIIYVGRIHKLKGIEDALEAFRIIHKAHKEWRFWIVGKGKPQYVEKIKRYINVHKLDNVTTHFGFVSEYEKYKLLSQAHILIAPSLYEGWGLMVSEASLMGTPAVGYNSGALRNSIIQHKTGVLVEANNPSDLARHIRLLISDKKRYRRYQKNGIAHTRLMSWENTADSALRIITQIR